LNINQKVLDLPNLIDNTNPVQTKIGMKYFELTNHLGNVLTTISDRKIEHGSGTTVDYYTADIISATDYYPFGFAMDSRNFSSSDYRFGFNGMEKDNEFTNSTSHYDFGARIYDSRLGRWSSTDAYENEYPDLSTYSFAGNNPVLFKDSDGNKIYIYYTVVDETGKEKIKAYEYGSGLKMPKYKYVRKTVRTLNRLKRKGYDKLGIIDDLANDEEYHVAIREKKNPFTSSFMVEAGKAMKVGDDGSLEETDELKYIPDDVSWCPKGGVISPDGRERMSAAGSLLHEIAHTYYRKHDPYGIEKSKEIIRNAADTEDEYNHLMSNYKKTVRKQIGDYGTASDKWIIQNVEVNFKGEWKRKNHFEGYFTKTIGGSFSKFALKYGRWGETGKVKDLKKGIEIKKPEEESVSGDSEKQGN
jgi:RHS repeat-associated protein